MVICIFGASSNDIDKKYMTAVEKLGEELARRGHELMFGGGANGLMGASARGFKAGNGKVTGVAPRFFDTEGRLFKDCDDFVFPDSMRDRKKYMEDNSDAFIAVPGGIGTYEELFEVLTLKQLARHAKPIALYNINGFFDRLTELIKDNAEKGFIREQTLSLFSVFDSMEELISYIENDKTDIDKISF